MRFLPILAVSSSLFLLGFSLPAPQPTDNPSCETLISQIKPLQNEVAESLAAIVKVLTPQERSLDNPAATTEYITNARDAVANLGQNFVSSEGEESRRAAGSEYRKRQQESDCGGHAELKGLVENLQDSVKSIEDLVAGRS
ncbi:hypothetical protein N7509_001345 [Penicillium cosmopolitanum]|uniref:Uncharacterized protein n=1 Tax=Penicillium cosmopolitanum TaxID=1131564 RepID=A0A9W9WCJ0_9EURO|nr:uncharacterized protein N7509_001345 [Penicillium cosmopolitanum]KAJ5414718.1 hypothetical protein N7509_001345 [Penicillium cosmopolitanum]